MRKKAKKIFASLLAGSMVMNVLSFNTLAVENTSDIQIVDQGGKMYYLADPAEGEIASAENFDVWTSKTIAGTGNEDEFEITLQVGTTMKAVPNDVAVVLVMDASGSMMRDEDGNTWQNGDIPDDKKTRIEYAREAALEFSQALVEGSGNAQRMLSIVEFGNNALTILPWTDANDNGVLDERVEEAIESVDVNFLAEANISYWNEEKALNDFGKINYWDSSEDTAAKKDYFVDFFESYLVKETITVGGETATPSTAQRTATDSKATKTTIEITKCTYEGCDRTDEHEHCSFEGCTESRVHTHCTYENCTVTDEHIHCEKCDDTSVGHTHIVGCTLDNCPTPYEGPHTHSCVHGGDTMYPYYCFYNAGYGAYGYRCLDPDPEHTHDLYDGDIRYLVQDKFVEKFKNCGTNMEGGLLLARNLVTTGLAENGAIEGIDDVYVILLSDGNPTYHTDEDSTTEVEYVKGLRGGGNYSTWDDLKDIVSSGEDGDTAIAEDIKAVSNFYTILYGSALGDKLGGGHELANVTGKEWFETKNDAEHINYVGADEVFDTPESENLNTVFLAIKNRIDMLAKAWVVTDELGGNELGDDVTFEEFTLNGTHAAVTPASNSKNTTISWSLGSMEPESGTGGMADPYIYTLKYKVTLNSAKDNVKEISLAHDAGTSDEAVWTNNGASLQYFMVEEEELEDMTSDEIAEMIRIAAFEKPSVKGIYGDFGFIKKNGKTGEVIEGAGFTLFDSNGKAYGKAVFSNSEGKVVFNDIPRGEYNLKETTLPDGMQKADVLALEVSWGKVSKADGSILDAFINNWPEGIEPTTPEETTPSIEPTTPEETTPSIEPTTPEETTPSTEPTTKAPKDDDDEPRYTPTTAPTETTTPVVPETDVITATEPETLPYVAPDTNPNDIPQEVLDAYYDRYIRGEIGLDDIPVGVLGAFYEKGLLAVAPHTGTFSGFWTMMTLVSLFGLALTTVFDRKKVK